MVRDHVRQIETARELKGQRDREKIIREKERGRDRKRDVQRYKSKMIKSVNVSFKNMKKYNIKVI